MVSHLPPDILLLDVGGVVLTVQDRQKYDSELSKVAVQFGVSSGSIAKGCFYDSAQWKAAKVGKMTHEEFFTSVCNEHGVSEKEDCDRIGQMVRLAGRGVDTRMLQLLGEIHKRNSECGDEGRRPIRLAVLSNYDNSLDYILSKFPGLSGHFELVMNSALLGVAKPSRECFELALSHLGLSLDESKDRVLFVDDKARNTDAAKEVGGWKTVTFANRDGDYDAIREILGLGQKNQTAQ